jgi:hypothetical protein
MPDEIRSAPLPLVGHGDRTASSGSSENGIFRKEGEYWTVGYGKRAFRLKDTKGFAYLAHLLRHPETEFQGLSMRRRALLRKRRPLSLSTLRRDY